MREKLSLTEKELLNSTWISLQLQMSDFPSYDYEKKDKVIKIKSKEQAEEVFKRLQKSKMKS